VVKIGTKFMVLALEFMVKGLGIRVYDSEFRVLGSG
jgi:hypothetical protein